MRVKLNGQEYLLQYPLASCLALERQTKLKLFDIIESIGSGDVGLDMMVSLIWAGLLHQNKRLTVEMLTMWLEDCPLSFKNMYEEAVKIFFESIHRTLVSTAEEKK